MSVFLPPSSIPNRFSPRHTPPQIGNWQHWNWQHSHIGNTSAQSGRARTPAAPPPRLHESHGLTSRTHLPHAQNQWQNIGASKHRPTAADTIPQYRKNIAGNTTKAEITTCPVARAPDIAHEIKQWIGHATYPTTSKAMATSLNIRRMTSPLVFLSQRYFVNGVCFSPLTVLTTSRSVFHGSTSFSHGRR